MLKFILCKKDGHIRRDTLKLNHGKIEMPAFMPVGTYGSVKVTNPQNLHDIRAQIISGNTCHLWLRPGLEVVEQFGSPHEFTGWDEPILADSGGSQALSLSDMHKLTEKGCIFQGPINDGKLFLSPGVSMKIRTALNSDIMMQLDECTPGEAAHSQAQKSLQMSLCWAERSKKAFEDLKNPSALFGIIQGAVYEGLHEESLKGLEELDFPSLTIGGLSVGGPKPEVYRTLRATGPIPPEHKLHHLMGVGTPEDLVCDVVHGVDMFDYVMLTHNARSGWLFTRFDNLKIENVKHKLDKRPIGESCACYTRQNFSRFYLHHLHRVDEILGAQLNTIHSLHFYQVIIIEMCEAIEQGKFADWQTQFHENRARDVDQSLQRSSEARF